MNLRLDGGWATDLCERNRAASAWMIVSLACSVTLGCGRAGGQPPDVPMHLTSSSDPSAPGAAIADRSDRSDADALVDGLEQLRKAARFDEYVAGTLAAARQQPDNAAIGCATVEALLATGDNESAAKSALDAAALALEQGDQLLTVRALRLWIVARMRLGQALDDATAHEIMDQLCDDPGGASLVRYWMRAFSERQPYARGDNDPQQPVELSPTKAAEGTIWAELNAVEVAANGVTQPMVFIDTGAQQTIMTLRAAETAGVTLGEGTTELVGFAGVVARPAVLDTLDLGGLTLQNVPVLVGNAPALMSANGQMAIGTELMHHVRFTLDYPARRVLVERANRAANTSSDATQFEVPLWTFSQACLARAETDRGSARVMIDTGNRLGTYVSARWARQHLPQFEHPTSNLVFKFRHQGLSLATMQMGGLVLRDWPIWDGIPRELEKLDAVDVLVGRDLLWPYRLSIDLSRRVLRIEGGPAAPTPPAESIP